MAKKKTLTIPARTGWAWAFLGIDLIKNKAKDTWWQRHPLRLVKVYDVHIGDDWEKPAIVIVRLIKSKMEDFFKEAALGGG